jgi:hypothetical protein
MKPKTYSQINVSNGQEWGVTSAYDYARLLPIGIASVEVTLPNASEVLGRRYTFGNRGTADAYLNPASGTSDTLLGTTETHTVVPGAVISLQAVQTAGSSYGWEQVG